MCSYPGGAGSSSASMAEMLVAIVLSYLCLTLVVQILGALLIFFVLLLNLSYLYFITTHITTPLGALVQENRAYPVCCFS